MNKEELEAKVRELEAERDRLVDEVGAINSWHIDTMRKLGAEQKRADANALLERLVKYYREDRPITPGSSRLSRLVGDAARHLAGQRAAPPGSCEHTYIHLASKRCVRCSSIISFVTNKPAAPSRTEAEHETQRHCYSCNCKLAPGRVEAEQAVLDELSACPLNVIETLAAPASILGKWTAPFAKAELARRGLK